MRFPNLNSIKVTLTIFLVCLCTVVDSFFFELFSFLNNLVGFFCNGWNQRNVVHDVSCLGVSCFVQDEILFIRNGF